MNAVIGEPSEESSTISRPRKAGADWVLLLLLTLSGGKIELEVFNQDLIFQIPDLDV